MAHRCGFTPSVLLQRLRETALNQVVLRLRPSLELAAVARKPRSPDAIQREALLNAFEL